MQPGAESRRAVEICREHGINVIADGSCILVVLGFSGALNPNDGFLRRLTISLELYRSR